MRSEENQVERSLRSLAQKREDHAVLMGVNQDGLEKKYCMFYQELQNS